MKIINHIIESEVLVIGSGLAGSLAAIKCHELGSKVTIVTKGALCWGGSTSLCGGCPLNVCFPTDDKDFWMSEFVEGEDYIIDQQWVKIHLEETYGYLLELIRLGKEFQEVICPPDPCTKKGGLWRFQDYGNKIPMSVLFDCMAALDTLRKKIIADRLAFYERVEMTNLLTDGQRVGGAVGFNYRNGETYLFKAKAVILAAAGTQFKIYGADNCGEGIAMAYDAGAKIKSLDRGGVSVRPRFSVHTAALGDAINNGMPYVLGAKLVNRLGVAYMEKVSSEIRAAGRLGFDISTRKEIEEGRGPIFEDYTQIHPEVKEILKKVKNAHWKLTRRQLGVDPFEVRVPLALKREQTAVPAGSSRVGGVGVNYECTSNIPGLYAIGDNSCDNIGVQHPFGGNGTAWALLSGSRVGKFVKEYISLSPYPAITDKDFLEQAKEYFANTALPFTRSNGISPEQVTTSLLRCLIPYDEVHSHKDSLEGTLREIEKLKKEELPRVKARDYHELKKTVEVQSMLLNAEMILRSELFRQESRCGMRRKDFPLTDNINWLKWIIVEKSEGNMHVHSEDVPTPYIEPPRSIYPPRLLRL